jgi:hypothetical protein
MTREPKNEMYDPGSQAVQRMADAFAHGKPGRLTPAQKQTIAFALRAMHPDKSWIAGFAACAYLMTGRYDDYARERNAALEPKP